MDRKRLEARLIEWSSDFGFTLPNGLSPPANYFSPLTATPHRSQLWEAILKVIEPRHKVELIRKQIFLSKIKTNQGKVKSKDYFLHAINEASHDKLNLWKKKEMLEKEIKEKRREIENLESFIENHASLIQSEICKMAEVEKQCLEYRNKTMILELSLKKYKERYESYLEFLKKIRKCRNVYELEEPETNVAELKNLVTKINKEISCSCDGNNECEVFLELNKICQDKITESAAWETIIHQKNKSTEDLNKSLIKKWTYEDEHLNEEKSRLAPLKSSVEKIKLDVTEKSLQVILNHCEEKALDLKIKEMYKKLSIKGDSVDDSSVCSFLTPDESTDEVADKVSKLKDGLNYLGLKKRLEFLKLELGVLEEDCKRKEFYLEEKEEADRKLLESKDELENLFVEIQSLKSQQKSNEDQLKEEYSELESAVDEVKLKVTDSNYIKTLEKSIKGLENSIQEYVEIIATANLDAFKRVQAPSGKEILECESLPHCLNNYGGELKELFSSLLISPYQSVESIISTVESRRNFSNAISKLISKAENFYQERQVALKNVSSDFDYNAVDKNNKEIEKILTKALNRLENMLGFMESVERILNAWSEQPFRHMIPDSKKQNDLTYRQYESQYQKSLDVLNYYSNVRKT